jgi:hypothetical protein
LSMMPNCSAVSMRSSNFATAFTLLIRLSAPPFVHAENIFERGGIPSFLADSMVVPHMAALRSRLNLSVAIYVLQRD